MGLGGSSKVAEITLGLSGMLDTTTVPVRSAGPMWLCNFVVHKRGGQISTEMALDLGFPADHLTLDPQSIVQKSFKKLVNAGVPLTVLGGRRYRQYIVPEELEGTAIYSASKGPYKGRAGGSNLGARQTHLVGPRDVHVAVARPNDSRLGDLHRILDSNDQPPQSVRSYWLWDSP